MFSTNRESIYKHLYNSAFSFYCIYLFYGTFTNSFPFYCIYFFSGMAYIIHEKHVHRDHRRLPPRERGVRQTNRPEHNLIIKSVVVTFYISNLINRPDKKLLLKHLSFMYCKRVFLLTWPFSQIINHSSHQHLYTVIKNNDIKFISQINIYFAKKFYSLITCLTICFKKLMSKLKLFPYIYIILCTILGSRRIEMEAPNYALYEPTFDPNELKREMAKMAITRRNDPASDNEQENPDEKTEEQVSREMSPYWKLQAEVDKLAGKAAAECALVHREIPYMIRSLIVLDNNWVKVDTILRKNGEQGLISIFLPPQRPLYVICGTSHVKNLARIAHIHQDGNEDSDDDNEDEHRKENDVKVHSDRTAFVILNTGCAAGFKFWGQLILATITRELQAAFPSFTPENYHPVLLLMSPFPWNLGYRNDVYYVKEKRFETPWEKTMAENIMKATEMIIAHISGNPAINMALAWMDHPILPKQQVRSFRLNKIAKEVNYLLDPNLPSCRSWRTTLTTVRNGDSEPLEVTSMSHLFFNTNMYGDGEGKDNSHLSDPGSSV